MYFILLKCALIYVLKLLRQISIDYLLRKKEKKRLTYRLNLNSRKNVYQIIAYCS